MSDFSRTQRLIAISPMDILWEKQQERETSFILAEEKGKATALTITEILSDYTFTPYEHGTLSDAYGEPSQLAMTVTKKDNAKMRFLVIAKNSDGGGVDWQAYCPPFAQESGPIILAAMQTRLERNRAGRAA